MLTIHLSVKFRKTGKGVSDLVPQSMYGIEKKKVPLSRCIPPETGSGRINAPHGGRNYIITDGHKKGQRLMLANYRRLFQMECVANMGKVFGMVSTISEKKIVSGVKKCILLPDTIFDESFLEK